MRMRLGVCLLLGQLLGFWSPMAMASPPGTVPFGFFKGASGALAWVFKVIGAYGQPSAGFVTGQWFYARAADGGVNGPSGVALDAANQLLYVVDSSNHRIIKLNAATGAMIGAIGKVTASTGSCSLGAAPGWCMGGTFGSGMADGMFSGPGAITLDAANGWLYVADSGNHRVVKVNASTGSFIGAIGNVTSSTGSCTLGPASGWCTGGSFYSEYGDTPDGTYLFPIGVAVDAAHNALFVSSGGGRITKVNASTGAFIGSIGKVMASTGSCAIGVAAGWCAGGTIDTGFENGAFYGTRAVAVDPAAQMLYIADSTSNRVSKIASDTGAFVGAIGNVVMSSGTCPLGVAPGWCTGGTFASGSGDGMFNSPYGLALDPANDALYVTEFGNDRINRLTASTGAFVGAVGRVTASTGSCPVGAASGWCTGGTFGAGESDGSYYDPKGIAVDALNGRLYVADSYSHRIVKVNVATGAFMGSLGGVRTALPGWSASPAEQVLGMHDGAFTAPSGLAADGVNGLLYVADKSNHRIGKVATATGTFLGAVGNAVSSTGSCPAGVAAGWCTGGRFNSGPGDGAFNNPTAVALDRANDRLYVADRINHRILKFVASTGAFVGAIGKTTASTGSCVVGAVPGWCTGGTFALGNGNGMFNAPSGVAVDATNNILYVGDSDNHRIVKITASTGAFVGAVGRVTTGGGTCAAGSASSWCAGGVFGSGAADGMFNIPFRLALDGAAQILYAADRGNNRIVKLAAGTGAFLGAIGRTTASSGTCAVGAVSGWCTGGTFATGAGDGMLNYPTGLALDTAANALYIADAMNRRLVKANLTTGAFIGAIGRTSASTGTCPIGIAKTWCTGGTFSSGAGEGSFSLPEDIAVDTSKALLYVTDSSNYRVVKVSR